jgi:hypothetical protein
MTRRRRPPSQGWKTFLHNHADGIASMDLFLVPTISFRLVYGFLILQHARRELLWLGVTAHPSAEWIAHQLAQAYGWQLRDASFATGIAPMAMRFSAGCEPWVSEIGRSHHDRPGRTDVRSGSSDRSDGIALTMSLCLASAISGICSIRTRNITTRHAHTYHYGRMRRSLALCRPSVRRSPCLFWVGCITNISAREFPTGTTGATAQVAMERAQLPLAITHSRAYIVLADRKSEEFAATASDA